RGHSRPAQAGDDYDVRYVVLLSKRGAFTFTGHDGERHLYHGFKNNDVSGSGFDESVVSILAFVDHSEALGVGVAEDEKLIRFTRQAHRGLFSGHRFHCITTSRDDSWRT